MPYGANRTSGGTSPRRPAIALAALVAASLIAAATLVLWGGFSRGTLVALPLTVPGLALVVWNTRWTLCYVAFCIMPFCVVQREMLGVTVNLPEALILLLAIKEGARALARRDILPPSLPAIPLLLFLAAAGIALATGIFNGNGIVNVLQDFRQFVEFMVLFWLVLRCVDGRAGALNVAMWFVLGASLIAIHGIVQHFTFIGISDTQIASDLVLHRGVRSGSFYGATTLGGLMILAIGPAIGVMLTSRRRVIQVLMLACIALCLVAAVYTKTRGSWVGLLVAFAFVAFAVRPGKKTLAAAAAIALIFALSLGPTIWLRIATLSDPESDRSLMARAQYYTAAWYIGRSHPILGLGWGCYYNIEEILTHERYVASPRPAVEVSPSEGEDAAVSEGEEEATVHSAYLQLFVKTGAIGLAGFLAIIVVWIERAGRLRRVRLSDDPGHALFIGITAGVAGYLVHSTFENFFQWPVMAQSFWLLLGLSFLTAPAIDARPRYTLSMALAGATGVLFAGFMAYCLYLESIHTDHFERNVNRALEENDLDRALDIARRATEMAPGEPMPHTVYARVLLLNDQPETALDQLERAVGATTIPPAIRKVDTGARYYFAPARLTLGAHYTAIEDPVSAMKNFELARAFADHYGPAFTPFHSALYRAYAGAGHWARALEFGAPSEGDLASVPTAQLLQIARVYEGGAHWDKLEAIVAIVQARGDIPVETFYLEGRVHTARGEWARAVAAYDMAIALDVRRARYYLGRALEASGKRERALEVYASVPGGAFHRLPALARMAALPAPSDKIVAELRDALAGLRPLDAGGRGGESPSLLPVAWLPAEAGANTGGRFPVLVVWGGEGYNPADVTAARVLSDGDNNLLVSLEGTPGLLQLHWLENEVYWPGVERSATDATSFPGWIDTARDWFEVRGDSGAHARRAAGEVHLELEPLTWFYAVPVPAAPGARYLIAGRARMPRGGGLFGWQLLDEAHNVTASQRLAGGDPLPGWTWRSGVQAVESAGSIRVLLESHRGEPAIAFDDVMLLELEVPAWPSP